MKIAYLISAYTDAPHIRFLIDSLLTEDTYFFIHVDKKVDIEPFKIAVKDKKHVCLLENRIKVAWGGWSQVETQIEMIKSAKNANVEFDYFFIISGQDYPIWSNARIQNYLASIGDKELICAKNLCHSTQEEKDGYSTVRPFNDHQFRPHTPLSVFRVLSRNFIKLLGIRKKLEFDADGHHYQLYKGSDYFGISRKLADFILDRWQHSPELKQYYKNSFIPSETFIHTIVFSSSWKDKCQERDGDASFSDITLLTYIDYPGPIHIKKLDESDYNRIVESDKMLCRKVVTKISDNLVRLIDKKREEEEQSFVESK